MRKPGERLSQPRVWPRRVQPGPQTLGMSGERWAPWVYFRSTR